MQVRKINVSSLPNRDILTENRPDIFSIKFGKDLSAEPIPDRGYSILKKDDNGIQIGYHDTSDLMTALGDVISEDEQNKFVHEIEFRGLMLDASRNGVPKVEFLKTVLVNLSLLGINHFCLYTEDTYEVEGEPLIGYGRGKYSKNELRELVEHAKAVGITMFPCIQTLGHLEQILKYNQYAFLRDTERVLNALKPETYEFLDYLISEASEPYDTNLIHVGMDETWGIGRGEAFTEEEAIRPLKIYAEHVAKVAEICEAQGLQPIMWGDFVIGRTEKPMNEYEKSLLPENVIMDYWEYASADKEEYRKNIQDFRKMGYEPLFSPGLHNWGRFFPLLEKVSETVKCGMEAIHEEGVKKVLMTMWGDDGQECLFPFNYPGISLYSLYLKTATPILDSWSNRVEKLFGITVDKFSEPPVKLENISKSPDLIDPKKLFYDDPLYGYITHLLKEPETTAREFETFAENLSRSDDISPEFLPYLELKSLFYRIIALKVALISGAAGSYKNLDKEKLAKFANNAPEASRKICEFRKLYRKLWMKERKPFGFEVMDLRLSGMNGRLESFQAVINEYLAGKSENIPEFDLNIQKNISSGDFSIFRKLSTRSLSLW